MTTINGTDKLLASFKDRLKDTLESRQKAMEEGKKPIADLLFQFLGEVAGYLDVAVVHADEARPTSGSPYSAKKPNSLPPKVASVLGKIEGDSYYCRNGELCISYQDAGRSTLPYPQIKTLSQESISEKLALALIEETIKRLEFFANSKSDPVPEPCEGFVIRYSVHSIDRTKKVYRFAFIKKTEKVQDYQQAVEAFSARYKSDHGQKRLQVMGETMIYVGRWILFGKNLSPKASIMDSRIAGITPTDLVVHEHSESPEA